MISYIFYQSGIEFLQISINLTFWLNIHKMRNAMKENIVLFSKLCMYDFLRILLALHIDGFYLLKMVYIVLRLDYDVMSTFQNL